MDYSKSKIYKIYCDENDDIYYGSTTQKLYDRLSHHKSNRNTTKSQNIMKNTYHIELVEDYPCNNKKELQLREKYYIQTFPCINKCIPLQTHQQWLNKNKSKVKQSRKNYHNKNKKKSNKESNRYYHWVKSFGGDPRNCNCLLKIDINLFQY